MTALPLPNREKAAAAISPYLSLDQQWAIPAMIDALIEAGVFSEAKETGDERATIWDEGYAAGKNPRRYGDPEFWKWDDFDSTFYERFSDGREFQKNPYSAVALAVPETKRQTTREVRAWSADPNYPRGDTVPWITLGNPGEAALAIIYDPEQSRLVEERFVTDWAVVPFVPETNWIAPGPICNGYGRHRKACPSAFPFAPEPRAEGEVTQ